MALHEDLALGSPTRRSKSPIGRRKASSYLNHRTNPGVGNTMKRENSSTNRKSKIKQSMNALLCPKHDGDDDENDEEEYIIGLKGEDQSPSGHMRRSQSNEEMDGSSRGRPKLNFNLASEKSAINRTRSGGELEVMKSTLARRRKQQQQEKGSPKRSNSDDRTSKMEVLKKSVLRNKKKQQQQQQLSDFGDESERSKKSVSSTQSGKMLAAMQAALHHHHHRQEPPKPTASTMMDEQLLDYLLLVESCQKKNQPPSLTPKVSERKGSKWKNILSDGLKRQGSSGTLKKSRQNPEERPDDDVLKNNSSDHGGRSFFKSLSGRKERTTVDSSSDRGNRSVLRSLSGRKERTVGGEESSSRRRNRTLDREGGPIETIDATTTSTNTTPHQQIRPSLADCTGGTSGGSWLGLEADMPLVDNSSPHVLHTPNSSSRTPRHSRRSRSPSRVSSPKSKQPQPPSLEDSGWRMALVESCSQDPSGYKTPPTGTPIKNRSSRKRNSPRTGASPPPPPPPAFSPNDSQSDWLDFDVEAAAAASPSHHSGRRSRSADEDTASTGKSPGKRRERKSHSPGKHRDRKLSASPGKHKDRKSSKSPGKNSTSKSPGRNKDRKLKSGETKTSSKRNSFTKQQQQTPDDTPNNGNSKDKVLDGSNLDSPSLSMRLRSIDCLREIDMSSHCNMIMMDSSVTGTDQQSLEAAASSSSPNDNREFFGNKNLERLGNTSTETTVRRGGKYEDSFRNLSTFHL